MRSVLPWVIVASCVAAPARAAERLPLESQSRAIVLERVGSEHGLSHNSVFAIVQDAQGFLWFGTQDGLNPYDGVEFAVYKHDPADPHSLRSSWITALLEDSSGRLWVGTYEGLFLRHTAAGPLERVETHDFGKGVLTSEITTILPDRAGSVWIGTFGGVASVRSPAKRHPARAAPAGRSGQPCNANPTPVVSDVRCQHGGACPRQRGRPKGLRYVRNRIALPQDSAGPISQRTAIRVASSPFGSRADHQPPDPAERVQSAHVSSQEGQEGGRDAGELATNLSEIHGFLASARIEERAALFGR